VIIIEIVPKEVALSASLISGDFTILEDDPILEFRVPVSEIEDGKATLTYTVAGDVAEHVGNIETVARGEEAPVVAEVVVEEEVVSSVSSPRMRTLVGIGIFIVFIGIIIALMKRKK